MFNLQQFLIDFLFVLDFLFWNFLEIKAPFIWKKGKGLNLKQTKKKKKKKKTRNVNIKHYELENTRSQKLTTQKKRNTES